MAGFAAVDADAGVLEDERPTLFHVALEAGFFIALGLGDQAGPLAHATIYGSILAAMERGDAGQVRRYCREAAARFPDDALLAATLAAVQ